MVRLLAVFAALTFGIVAPLAAVAQPAAPASPTVDLPTELIAQSLYTDAKIRMGPDGFPYIMAVRKPDAIVAGKSYTMPNLAKLAMRDHSGIAVFEHATNEPKPVWVFSLGAAVLLAQSTWIPAAGKGALTTDPTDRINIGTPSTTYLPGDVRKALHAFLSYDAHVATPKIAMIVVLTAAGKPKLPYAMSANIPPSAYPSQQQWQNELRKIQWFIPPNIDFVQPPTDPKTFAAWFKPVEPI
jgi:hypothetical protein